MPFRHQWGDFPPLQILSNGTKLAQHPAHFDASHGDVEAARRLIHDLAPSPPPLAPAFVCPVVHLDMTQKWDAIPYALAELFAKHYRAKIVLNVVQTNINPEGTPYSTSRLLNQPTFDGTPPQGSYLILDSFARLGSTIANLRSHLITHGAKPLAASVLSFAHFSNRLALDPSLLRLLSAKHGSHLGTIKETLGFSPECLTQREAHFLIGIHNLEALRNPQLQTNRVISNSFGV